MSTGESMWRIFKWCLAIFVGLVLLSLWANY